MLKNLWKLLEYQKLLKIKNKLQKWLNYRQTYLTILKIIKKIMDQQNLILKNNVYWKKKENN